MREPRGVAELAGVGRLELPTLGLEIRCSIQLSYTPSMTCSLFIFDCSRDCSSHPSFLASFSWVRCTYRRTSSTAPCRNSQPTKVYSMEPLTLVDSGCCPMRKRRRGWTISDDTCWMPKSCSGRHPASARKSASIRRFSTATCGIRGRRSVRKFNAPVTGA